MCGPRTRFWDAVDFLKINQPLINNNEIIYVFDSLEIHPQLFEALGIPFYIKKIS